MKLLEWAVMHAAFANGVRLAAPLAGWYRYPFPAEAHVKQCLYHFRAGLHFRKCAAALLQLHLLELHPALAASRRRLHLRSPTLRTYASLCACYRRLVVRQEERRRLQLGESCPDNPACRASTSLCPLF